MSAPAIDVDVAHELLDSHCGRPTVDLVCDHDRALLDTFLHRCEVCGCTNPPARRTVEPL